MGNVLNLRHKGRGGVLVSFSSGGILFALAAGYFANTGNVPGRLHHLLLTAAHLSVNTAGFINF